MSAIALHPAQDNRPDREAVRRTITAQLTRLPALQARAFRLREIEGHAPAHICALLGISDEMLRELLYEARVAMCGALAAEGLVP